MFKIVYVGNIINPSDAQGGVDATPPPSVFPL